LDEQSTVSSADWAIEGASLVLDSLPWAVVVWDLHGTILAWNRDAELLYGWPAPDAIGRHIETLLIAPDNRDEAREIVQLVESGSHFTGDITIRRRDGETLRTSTVLNPLLDHDGEVIGTVGASVEVAELRLLEQRAVVLADHLVLALAAGRLGVWQWDIATGVVTWDSTMETMYGLGPGTFGGTYDAYVALLHPDDRPHTVRTVDSAVDDQSYYEVEHRVVWPDGSVHWIQGRAMVTLGPDGAVTGTVGYSTDVTVAKLHEQESLRRAAEAEAIVANERLARRRLEFLAGLNHAASTATNHTEVMQRATQAAVPMLGDWCSLHFFPTSGGAPEIVMAHSDSAKIDWLREVLVKHPYNPDAPFGVAAAVRTKTTQFIETFDDEVIEAIASRAVRALPHEAREIFKTLQLTSLIAVPLITNRGVIGAMQFVSAESGRHYDEADLALATIAAGRVGEALDRIWVAEQQRNVAHVLQSALLPPRLPEIEGVSVAVRYWAAGAVSEVGGDFYDVFEIPGPGPRKWAVVIGDVCGTGPEAAAVTAIARHTIRAAAKHGASPVEVLEWLNEALLAGGLDRFCTVLYSTIERIDAQTWRYTSVAGGHPLPLHIAPGAPAQLLGRPGTLLGVVPQLRLSSVATELRVGDTIVLNTDGVTDVPAPNGLSDDQLADLVSEAAAVEGSAEQVAVRLGDAVQRILPIPDRDDDIALVVLRVGADLEADGL